MNTIINRSRDKKFHAKYAETYAKNAENIWMKNIPLRDFASSLRSLREIILHPKLFIIIFLLPVLSSAQIVTDRTNAIVMDLSKEGNNTVLPEIEWIYPRIEYTHTQENRITIEANVKSTVPLKEVTVGIKQDREAESRGTRAVEMEEEARTVSISRSMFLMEGENWIEIMAETEEGGIVKDCRSVLLGFDAISDAVAIDRKDYAILFATDKFDHFKDLVNPVFDAHSIAKELEERYGFIVEIVENPNQDDVMVKLREYAQKNYKPQDQLMVFFAGHGHYDDVYGEGYVVAKNSLVNDEGKNTYISHNRIRNNINNIQCEHIFLVMDVCFGGTFDPVLASARNVYEDTQDREYLIKKLSMKTRKYLTSGSKEYVSDGIVGQHSPFAMRFIEALKTNGGEDRILILDEIKLKMERLQTTPRFGFFGDDEQGSDFVFVAR